MTKVNDSLMFATPIYRSVSAYWDHTIYPPRGDRVPKHIPLLIDNVWEYIRPDDMPSRRSSAFGSPTPELARLSGPEDGIICRVFVTLPCPAAQILGCSDARCHADVTALPVAIADLGIPDETVRLLSTALLSRAKLRGLLPPVQDLRAMLADASTFWQQCRRVRVTAEQAADDVGELFFVARGGYALEPLLHEEHSSKR